MIPPIFNSKSINQISKFKPELDRLRRVAESQLKDGMTHLAEVTSSGDSFHKVLAKDIVELSEKGASKTQEIVEEVSEQVSSIAKKSLDIMRGSDNPLAKNVAETVDENPNLNPVEVINKVKETITDMVSVAETEKKDIENEVIKEVVKAKVKGGFLGFLSKIFSKIKSFFVKPFKSDHIS